MVRCCVYQDLATWLILVSGTDRICRFSVRLTLSRSMKYVVIIICNTGCTQKNGAVSKVNKKFIFHLTRAQHTLSAAATVQVSYALQAVRFSCLLRGQFPRWHRSRKRLSVCSVLRCPDLWLQCSVSFVHSLEKTQHAWCTSIMKRKGVISRGIWARSCKIHKTKGGETRMKSIKENTQFIFHLCRWYWRPLWWG